LCRWAEPLAVPAAAPSHAVLPVMPVRELELAGV